MRLVCGLYLLISTFHPLASLWFLSIGLQIQVAVLLPWDMGMSIHPRALGNHVQMCVCVCVCARPSVSFSGIHIPVTQTTTHHQQHTSIKRIRTASRFFTDNAHFLPDVYFVIYEMWNCIDMLSNCVRIFFFF